MQNFNINNMEKYKFVQFTSSRITVDPLFGTSNFKMFGNPGSLNQKSIMFEIYDVCGNRFRYCLINPDDFLNNNELSVKARRFVLFKEMRGRIENKVNTYFIGDMSKSIEVSSEFQNQCSILVPIEMIEQWYPKTIKERIKIIISGIVIRQKYYGQNLRMYTLSDDEVLLPIGLKDCSDRDYRRFILSSMVQDGLANKIETNFSDDYFSLTAKGVDLVQEENDNKDNKKAFIAIKFKNNSKRINAIQKAISNAGFEPIVMTEYQTNEWIMPEIFYQIKKAKFVVVDFSLPCDGAYYEAGYAAALDKPVIHLFDKRKETQNYKLHFDVAQKSTVYYKSMDDLILKLENRIRATIR